MSKTGDMVNTLALCIQHQHSADLHFAGFIMTVGMKRDSGRTDSGVVHPDPHIMTWVERGVRVNRHAWRSYHHEDVGETGVRNG